MWLDLSRIDSEINFEKSSQNQLLGVALKAPESQLNMDAMAEFGFKDRSEDGYYRSGIQSFKLGDVKKWFRNFDQGMIDKNAPIKYLIIDNDPQDSLSAPDDTESADESVEVEDTVTTNSITETVRRKRGKKEEKINDYGEKIGGAKKDRYARSGTAITVKDLADMTEDEKKGNINKARLFAYSAVDAKGNGVSPGVCEFVFRVKRCLPEFGIVDLWGEKQYVEICGYLQALFDQSKVKTKEDLFRVISEERDKFVSFNQTVEQHESFDAKQSSYYRNKSRIKVLDDMADEGHEMSRDPSFPFYVASVHCNYGNFGYSHTEDFKKTTINRAQWLLGFFTQPYSRVLYDDSLDADPSVSWRTKFRVSDQAQKESRKEKKESEPKVYLRPHLDKLTGHWLPDHDITAKDLCDRFGFRAVEFGNWLPNDERQKILNEAYGACCALAHATGLPEKMISLNGSLAAAFGSRGRGRFAAHYEPDLKVFNMTRFNGAGSMAHEYAHALDHYISKASTLATETSARKYEGMIEYSFINDVMTAMRVSPASDADIQKMSNDHLLLCGKHASWALSWLQIFESSSIYNQAFKLAIDHIKTEDSYGEKFELRLMRDLLSLRNGSGSDSELKLTRKRVLNFETCLNEAALDYRRSESVKEKNSNIQVKSSFSSEALLLDKGVDGKYYSQTAEMFARSFESYVFDRLKNEDLHCDYLVHGVADDQDFYADRNAYYGNPYPSGAERERISHAIAQLNQKLREVVSDSDRENHDDQDEEKNLTQKRRMMV